MPLLVAAFSPEIEPLVGLARTATVGIGLVTASHGAALAIAKHGPGSVILVGTCGAYPGSGLRVGDVVVAARVGLASTAAARGQASLLSSMTASLEPDPTLTEALDAHGATPATVSTTLAVTTDDALAHLLRETYAADVEHLEAYAVAHACAAAKVRFACVLGVANAVGAKGRDEWKENHEHASARVAAVVKAWLLDRA
jgi:futalosine hydrolase